MFDFEKKILERSFVKPVIVEFSAPGCGPCKWMEKTLIEVIKQMKETIDFISLPVSDCPEYVKQYQVSSNPTTILFMEGKPKAQLKGALPKMVIEQWLNDHTGLVSDEKT